MVGDEPAGTVTVVPYEGGPSVEVPLRYQPGRYQRSIAKIEEDEAAVMAAVAREEMRADPQSSAVEHSSSAVSSAQGSQADRHGAAADHDDSSDSISSDSEPVRRPPQKRKGAATVRWGEAQPPAKRSPHKKQASAATTPCQSLAQRHADTPAVQFPWPEDVDDFDEFFTSSQERDVAEIHSRDAERRQCLEWARVHFCDMVKVDEATGRQVFLLKNGHFSDPMPPGAELPALKDRLPGQS